ncbi:MAG: HIT domain-containing protein [Syntrophales bacterium]|nr:HIT domain-containing protein [Syntrophales bacterium]
MENIIAHGRMEFIRSKKPEGCVFCKKSIREECLVLFENEQVFILVNKYSYNSGHLLIAPQRHISGLEELTPEESAAMVECLHISVRILIEVMHPEGFNIGMNVGKVAGAGVADHIHLHIVPRWNGDTSFMTCLADTRVTPEDPVKTYEGLRPHFDDRCGGAKK